MKKIKENLEEEIEKIIVDDIETNDIIIYDEEEDIDVSDLDDDDDLDIDNFSLSKHKIEGKHALKYDTIFKGKKEDITEDDDIPFMDINSDTIELDKSSSYYTESNDNESYFRSKKLKEKVYDVLNEYTDVDFSVNRRKPSKVDFNSYLCILKKHLTEYNFTNVEIFNELSIFEFSPFSVKIFFGVVASKEVLLGNGLLTELNFKLVSVWSTLLFSYQETVKLEFIVSSLLFEERLSLTIKSLTTLLDFSMLVFVSLSFNVIDILVSVSFDELLLEVKNQIPLPPTIKANNTNIQTPFLQ